MSSRTRPGRNASDVAFFANYRPWPRVLASLDLAFTTRGRDPEGEVYGANPLDPYNDRDRDRDRQTTTLQGIRQNQMLLEARLGYEILPELYLEGILLAESTDDAETGLDRYVAPFVSLRWGLPFTSMRY